MQRKARGDAWIRKYLRIYTAILLVCLCIVIVMSAYLSYAYERVIFDISTENIVKRAAREVESSIDTIQQSVLSFLVSNDALEAFMDPDSMTSDGFERYRIMMALRRDIKNSKDAHPAVYTMNVYNAKNHVLAAEDGLVYLSSETDAQVIAFMQNLLSGPAVSPNDEAMARIVPNYKQKGDLILYTRPYYHNEREGTKGIILYWLERSYYSDMLADTLSKSDGTLCVYSPDGQAYFGNTRDMPAESAVFEADPEDRMWRAVRGDELHIGYRSPATGWLFVAHMATKSIESVAWLLRLRTTLASFMVVYTIAMVVGMLYTGRRVYAQFISLVRRVQMAVNDDSRFGDSLVYLRNAFADMQQQNLDLQSAVAKYKPLVRLQMASALLYPGRIKSIDDHLANLHMIGVSLYEKGFAAIVVQRQLNGDDRGDWRHIILTMQGALPEGMLAVDIEQGEDTLVIIASFNADEAQLQNKLLRQFVQDFHGALTNADEVCRLIIGPIYPDYLGLPASYRTVSDVSRYAWLFKEDDAVYTEELFRAAFVNDMSVGAKDIQRILLAFRRGDEGALGEDIDSFFCNLTNLSPASYQMQINVLLANILQAAAEIGLSLDFITPKIDGIFFDVLSGSRGIDHAGRAMRELCAELLHEKERAVRGSSRLVNYVIQYINQKYGDSSLSLASVAERFQVSESHVSHVFKDVVGVTFRSYVEQVRIERAKTLLRAERAVIGDIAQEVGYINAQSFIRAFKRLEGMPPGQYRDVIGAYANASPTSPSTSI